MSIKYITKEEWDRQVREVTKSRMAFSAGMIANGAGAQKATDAAKEAYPLTAEVLREGMMRGKEWLVRHDPNRPLHFSVRGYSYTRWEEHASVPVNPKDAIMLADLVQRPSETLTF